jgi:hypothetical protein
MRVLFLDFDGVLNDSRFGARAFREGPVQAEYAARLQRVLDRSGAKVVLCTAWRVDGIAECRKHLERGGLRAEVIDATPDLSEPMGPYLTGCPPRWKEIRTWLEAHPEVERYVVLDDIRDMGPLAAQHVCPVDGLTDDDAELATELLLRTAP